MKKKRVETFRKIYGMVTVVYIGERERANLYSRTTGAIFLYILERCRSSWGEPERGRADIGTQAGMHNTWMCGQMRLLATCLALSRVPIVCT